MLCFPALQIAQVKESSRISKPLNQTLIQSLFHCLMLFLQFRFFVIHRNLFSKCTQVVLIQRLRRGTRHQFSFRLQVHTCVPCPLQLNLSLHVHRHLPKAHLPHPEMCLLVHRHIPKAQSLQPETCLLVHRHIPKAHSLQPEMFLHVHRHIPKAHSLQPETCLLVHRRIPKAHSLQPCSLPLNMCLHVDRRLPRARSLKLNMCMRVHWRIPWAHSSLLNMFFLALCAYRGLLFTIAVSGNCCFPPCTPLQGSVQLDSSHLCAFIQAHTLVLALPLRITWEFASKGRKVPCNQGCCHVSRDCRASLIVEPVAILTLPFHLHLRCFRIKEINSTQLELVLVTEAIGSCLIKQKAFRAPFSACSKFLFLLIIIFSLCTLDFIVPIHANSDLIEFILRRTLMWIRMCFTSCCLFHLVYLDSRLLVLTKLSRFTLIF